MKTEGSMTTAAPGENDGKKPNITAEQVRKLRERTGAPMMDCKKALEACNGNEDESEVWLRKKGMSTAAKKARRWQVRRQHNCLGLTAGGVRWREEGG